MLQEGGMIQYKNSFLKKESPKNAIVKPRFIHYNANYVKYCFLKEFYQLLFDGTRQGLLAPHDENDKNKLVNEIAEVVFYFMEHCHDHPSEENARELFRAFCKAHLFKGDENSP
jgi:hypothetical protein